MCGEYWDISIIKQILKELQSQLKGLLNDNFVMTNDRPTSQDSNIPKSIQVFSRTPNLGIFFLEYLQCIHFWPRRRGPKQLFSSNLPHVVSEIQRLLWKKPLKSLHIKFQVFRLWQIEFITFSTSHGDSQPGQTDYDCHHVSIFITNGMTPKVSAFKGAPEISESTCSRFFFRLSRTPLLLLGQKQICQMQSKKKISKLGVLRQIYINLVIHQEPYFQFSTQNDFDCSLLTALKVPLMHLVFFSGPQIGFSKQISIFLKKTLLDSPPPTSGHRLTSWGCLECIPLKLPVTST